MKHEYPETFYHDHGIEFFHAGATLDKDGFTKIDLIDKKPLFHCVKFGGTDKVELENFMKNKVFPLAQTFEKDFIIGGFVLIKDNWDKKLYTSNGIVVA